MRAPRKGWGHCVVWTRRQRGPEFARRYLRVVHVDLEWCLCAEERVYMRVRMYVQEKMREFECRCAWVRLSCPSLRGADCVSLVWICNGAFAYERECVCGRESVYVGESMCI